MLENVIMCLLNVVLLIFFPWECLYFYDIVLITSRETVTDSTIICHKGWENKYMRMLTGYILGYVFLHILTEALKNFVAWVNEMD